MARKPESRKPKDHQPTHRRRGSACKRGYDRKWRNYRKVYLTEHPCCVVPGCVKPATDVDHIVEVNGQQDPLFWEPSNHQGLCHAHHSQKTGRGG